MSNQSARAAVFELVSRVTFDEAYANLLVPKVLQRSGLDSRDRGLVQELAYGTIRWSLTLTKIIELASSRTEAQIDRNALVLLRLGAYQLLRTRIPKHAAINETVELAKELGFSKLSGFINAVLRRVSEHDFGSWVDRLTSKLSDDSEVLSIQYSHPTWVVTALKLALRSDGRETELESLLEADNTPTAVNLVLLPGRLEPISEQLRPHTASSTSFELPGGLDLSAALESGNLRVQDAGSALCAKLLVAAKPVEQGESWLDLCAGPGGKAVLLGAYASSKGAALTCVEPIEARSKLISKALEKSKLKATVLTADGRTVTGRFDRILVDAPCTGLGALRRRPESRYRRKQQDLSDLTKLQKDLLANAWARLKPGGVLVYSTCSPHPAETTAAVESLMKSAGQSAELLDAWSILQEPEVRPNLPRKTLQLWPHVHQTDAMFAAVIRKSLT